MIEDNRMSSTLGEEGLRKLAEQHIEGKLRAVEIMKKRTDLTEEKREEMVLEIVKQAKYLPIIRLMAGLPAVREQ